MHVQAFVVTPDFASCGPAMLRRPPPQTRRPKTAIRVHVHVNVDMIQILLDAGADPDLAVGDGLTPRLRFEKSHFLQHFRFKRC